MNKNPFVCGVEWTCEDSVKQGITVYIDENGDRKYHKTGCNCPLPDNDFEDRERFFKSEKFKKFVEDHKDIVTNGSVWDETKAIEGEPLEGFIGLYERVIKRLNKEQDENSK